MNIPLQSFFTPESIEAESFAIIDREVGPDRPFTGRAWEVARRLVHTTADFSILEHLILPGAAIDAGIAALHRGAPVFVDTEMARHGMTRRHLEPLNIVPECILTIPGTLERAKEHGVTRSRAGMELALPRLGGAIVAVGNAPTALLALLEHLQQGVPAPALVIALPVGFVNARESKDLFLQYCAESPHAPACIALRGRKGGSTLTAATVNALAKLAMRSRA